MADHLGITFCMNPTMSAPDGSLNNRYCVNSNSHEIRRILTPFGLTDPDRLLGVMYQTGAIIAGGAATNYIYNQLHPGDERPVHPESDIDFWIEDPMPADRHSRRVYYTFIMDRWRDFLESHGYSPETCEDYESAAASFQAECGAIMQVHYFRRNAPTHNRIQIIFYSGPEPAELVRNFDLTVSRSMIYVSGVNHLWIGHTFAEDDLIARRISVNRHPPTYRTCQRLQRYIERYGFHSMLSDDLSSVSN